MREVLFVSREHLDGLELEPGAIRENITVAGEDVQAWEIGRQVRAGEAVFEITMVCDPCHRMDELRDGLRAQLDGKRGMLARVVEAASSATRQCQADRLAARRRCSRTIRATPARARVLRAVDISV